MFCKYRVDVWRLLLASGLFFVPALAYGGGVKADKLMTRTAAKELQRWLAPLGYKKSEGGLRLVNRLRTGGRKRWGLRVSPKALKRWRPVLDALMLWNPIPLYQKLRAGRYDLRLFAKLKRLTWHISPPKRNQKAVYGPGRAGMDIKLQAVPRMHNQRRRPYRLTFSSFAPTVSIRMTQIDKVVRTLIERLTDPHLRVALPATQGRLFRSLRGQHSRRIARWLTSRFPRTARVLDRYVDVFSILEPVSPNSRVFRLKLRFRLKRRRVARASKRKRRFPKGSMALVLSLRDKPRGARWMEWRYHTNSRIHQISGVLTRGGFVRCSSGWSPPTNAKPWRPTKMGASWISHLRTRFVSRTIKVFVSHIMFGWKVRKTQQGASLAIAMAHNPKFKIKGLSTMRTLARFFVPGGVENLLRHFLYNMAYGDQRRGLRWRWDYVEKPGRSRVHFKVVLPMVPDRKLTSLLRFVPKPRPRSRRRKRRRIKRSPSFWKRLHTAVFADLRSAQRVLAMK